MHYDVVSVRPMQDYRLLISFEDGKSGVFDMGDYLGLPLFAPLRSVVLFNRAFVDDGTVAWPGEIDIAPERLWSDCVCDAPRSGRVPPA
ncbi:MAG: DUF2442 domain-containing protein [Coriobacteriales bacterium]|nr:DUF2442 domain-containing protein [Coriobacteriales bacterium]